MERCAWCCDNGLNQKYHDEEWGIPLHDDRMQFEFVSLEVMQCGLTWTLMLKKREIFRKCFAEFDYEKIAKFTEEDVMRILETEGMIRSRQKVEAIISNAKAYIRLREEFGSFDTYLWSFTDHKTMIYKKHHRGVFEASNELSGKISKDLKKRGFKYMGPITVYSHLQACGIINDHSPECFMYEKLAGAENVVVIED